MQSQRRRQQHQEQAQLGDIKGYAKDGKHNTSTYERSKDQTKGQTIAQNTPLAKLLTQ